MKLLPIFLVVFGLVGGGIGLMAASNQRGKLPSREEVSSVVKKQLLSLKSAGLKEVDCKSIDGAAVIDSSHCFFSSQEPDKLRPLIQKAMDPIGVTNGWSNDYGVPPENRTNLTRDEGSPPAVGWKARPTL